MDCESMIDHQKKSLLEFRIPYIIWDHVIITKLKELAFLEVGREHSFWGSFSLLHTNWDTDMYV